MASIITDALSVGAFELVRNRIGLILTEELPNQATLKADTDLDATVWIERFIPFANTECPAVNVSLAQGDYGDTTRLSQQGEYQFYIDVYDKAKSVDDLGGDQRASIKVQKVANICRAILSHYDYNTLAFAKPFISSTKVDSIKIGNPGGNKESANMVMARITFTVKVPESLIPKTPLDVDGYSTKLVLGLTDKGYLYGGEGFDPPVTPICAPVTINRDGEFLQFVDSGGEFNFSTDCDPATIEINGTLLGEFASGETANIPVEYENGTPVGTIEEGTVVIPNPTELIRIYNPPAYSGAADRGQDYDTYWRMLNNIGNYSQPMTGVAMRLEWGKYYMIHSDITIGNVFGNWQRWTGTSGGYFDWDTWYSSGKVTENYYDVDGVITTRELAFPDGIAVDHWIGGMVEIDQSGTDTFYDWLTLGAVKTIGAFTGWYLMSIPEIVSFGTWGDITLPYTDSPLFNWGTGAKLTADSYPASGAGNAMVAQAYGHLTSVPKANNNKSVYYKPIDINTIFG